MSFFDYGYELIDNVIANVPDCFVFRTNKIGGGNGEAKFYIGGTNTKDWETFFNYFKIKCFFTKEDLIKYLDMAKIEYEEQSQGYATDISKLWLLHREALEEMDDVIMFDVYHKEYENKSRYYIQSDDKIYTFFRKIALPIITSVLVQKIKIQDNFYLWFRPYINEIGNVFDNEIINELVNKEIEKINNDKTITKTEKLQLTKARIGQGKFRERVLEKYNSICIITKIDDERVLIASHIKPWSNCNNIEKLSKENGLLLTPTFDKLFDKGFISFTNNGELILSDYFNEANFKILNLKDKTKYNLKITDEMKKYLEYHRDIVFYK